MVGLVLKVPGTSEQFVLSDAETGELDRARLRGSFETDRPSLPILTAWSETELADLLTAPAAARISVGRVRLPRIRYALYWPPSARAVRVVERRAGQVLHEAHQRWWQFGERFDPGTLTSEAMNALTFEEIEGTDLAAIWEPVWPVHPAARDATWPFSADRQ